MAVCVCVCVESCCWWGGASSHGVTLTTLMWVCCSFRDDGKTGDKGSEVSALSFAEQQAHYCSRSCVPWGNLWRWQRVRSPLWQRIWQVRGGRSKCCGAFRRWSCAHPLGVNFHFCWDWPMLLMLVKRGVVGGGEAVVVQTVVAVSGTTILLTSCIWNNHPDVLHLEQPSRNCVCRWWLACVTCKRETEGYVMQMRVGTFVMFHVSKQPHIVPLMCILERFSA